MGERPSDKERALADMFHMVVRQAQAAYAAGLRDGPEACMDWLGNALAGPGNCPNDGADPDWYAADAWTKGPPWPSPPPANATLCEPADSPPPRVPDQHRPPPGHFSCLHCALLIHRDRSGHWVHARTLSRSCVIGRSWSTEAEPK